MKPLKLDPRLATAIWIGLIYATIPWVRRVREVFVARWPAEFISYAVMVVVVCITLVAVVFVGKTRPKAGASDLGWLVAVAAVVVFWTSRLMGQPEEAIHFLEYGVLGILLYRTFEDRVPDWTIYLAASLAGLIVGTIDEMIQWLVPDRFWDFRDIVLNGGAVALVQIAIWRLAPRPPTAISRSSLRCVCRLAAGLVLLLMICLAATPQRLSQLSSHVPMPDRLATGSDALCEYGFLHRVDKLTLFRSRLSSEELAGVDREQATRVGGELVASRGAGGLSRAGISPLDDPFGYEIRVHLFSRNRNLINANGLDPKSAAHQTLMTTAWRENLILEEFFGDALDQSSYRWGPRRRKEVEDTQDPHRRFVSRAGAHLITKLSEGQLRALLSILLLFFVACNVALSTRSLPESPPE